MGRKARFTKDDFVATALELLAAKGLGGVTMAAIAEKAGGPIGSVYHRFSSREVLLAELWMTLIESFQSGFLEQLGGGDIEQAALYTLKWVRKSPTQARVFLLYRREQLIAGDWPGDLRDRAEALGRELADGLNAFTRRLFGKTNKKNVDRVAFCLIQVPMSAVRSHLERGTPIPGYYDQFVVETCQALLGSGDGTK